MSNLCEEQNRTANYTGELLNRFKYCTDEFDCQQVQSYSLTNSISAGQQVAVEVLSESSDIYTIGITPTSAGLVNNIVNSFNTYAPNSGAEWFTMIFSGPQTNYPFTNAIYFDHVVSATNQTTYAEIVIDLSVTPVITSPFNCYPAWNYASLRSQLDSKLASADPIWEQDDSGTFTIYFSEVAELESPVMPVKIVCEDTKLKPVTGLVVPEFISVSTSGNTSANVSKVSITNVGGAAGTVMGANFPVGATVTYEAYFDNVVNEYRRLDSFTYDAIGTEFIIATTP
jgi:hypothetical protein